MLGVTNHLTTDVAAVPLLWIIPLSLYLLSFVIVFSPLRSRVHPIAVRAMPILLTGLAVSLLLKVIGSLALLTPLHLVTFFVIALVCHGELADDAPEVGHLTEFYLWLAIGGALGGSFNVLIAPLLFNSISEYPIALVFACFLLPGMRSASGSLPERKPNLLVPVAIGVLLCLSVLVLIVLDQGGNRLVFSLAVIVPLVLTFSLRDYPVRYGIAMAAIFLVVALAPDRRETLFAERTFFGVHHVVRDGSYNTLVHGNTRHGNQSRDPERAEEPLSYYSREGPLGTVFEHRLGITSNPHVGVIGLGTGAMACYAEPDETWTFFEIDPVVEEMARDPLLFTYLDRCLPGAEVVLGDGRLSVAETGSESFGLLAVDAFSSDAIPVHLLTREAVGLYLDKLSADGVLLFHISNRYVGLRPVLAAVAEEAGLVAYGGQDIKMSEADVASGRFPSEWVAMARSEEILQPLTTDKKWSRLVADPGTSAWTDDYSNVLSVLLWN